MKRSTEAHAEVRDQSSSTFAKASADTSCSKSYQTVLVLDGGIDCEKTGGPTKQVERRGRTKSGPIDPYAHSSTSHHKDELWLRYTAF